MSSHCGSNLDAFWSQLKQQVSLTHRRLPQLLSQQQAQQPESNDAFMPLVHPCLLTGSPSEAGHQGRLHRKVSKLGTTGLLGLQACTNLNPVMTHYMRYTSARCNTGSGLDRIAGSAAHHVIREWRYGSLSSVPKPTFTGQFTWRISWRFTTI